MGGVRGPVVLDCDPGHDDAVAILLAAAAPEIDLRAIGTSRIPPSVQTRRAL